MRKILKNTPKTKAYLDSTVYLCGRHKKIDTGATTMKDKEKQIEEMANSLEEEFVLCGTLSRCGTQRCSVCFSKYLYEQYYQPKLLEDSVVMSKEEYQKYCAYKIIEPQIKGCLDRERLLEKRLAAKENDIGKLEREIDDLKYELKQARQEAAKEIYKLADEIATGSQNDGVNIMCAIKQEFGL